MGYATKMFSKRLKELRETAGLTQEQLAKELKVSRGAISYYEKGERTPDIEFLDSVSEYFCLPLDFAIGYTNNLKYEHRNMYELYGLTDDACTELDHHHEIGNLISTIIEHKDFFALKKLYTGLIKNYNDFDYTQLGYISFLITDIFETIIRHSLCTLLDMQLTETERNNRLQEDSDIAKEVDRILTVSQMRETELHQRSEAQNIRDAERDIIENSVQYSAIEKIQKKFNNTIYSAESAREFK